MKPFFLRTRRLDIRRLERKRPESLHIVHVILAGQVRHVLEQVAHLEQAYYGRGKLPEQELGRWAECTRAVLQAVRQSLFLSTLQVDLVELNRMKECYRKVLDTMPGKFGDVVADCRRVLKYLNKYCLSFYHRKEDLHDDQARADHVYLDTADNYETKRRNYALDIRKHVDRVTSLAERFKAGGIFLNDFSTYAKEIGRKAEVERHAPFLLLFPEACESVRSACAVMLLWLDLDKDYAVFIQNDIKEMERGREETKRAMHDYQNQYHQQLYRVRQLRVQYEEQQVALQALEDEEDNLLLQEEILVNTTNDIQLEMEIKEYRRDEVLRLGMPKVLRDNFPEEYDRYKELAAALRECTLTLPAKKRELLGVGHKIAWLATKKEELRMRRRTLQALDKQLRQVEKTKQELELEHEDLELTLDLAKQIHLFKSSSNAVEKIFLGMPMEVSVHRLPGLKNHEDSFERACDVVCEWLEADWPKLYRALPFHPQRGRNTIDGDIANLSQLESRFSNSELTNKALHRWRRFHTRARLEELKVALTTIRRQDVVRNIEEALEPVTMETEASEPEPNPYLEPELQVYLKDVERFDELRAANIL